MIDFSTVVAVDAHHLQEWKLSLPTWIKHRPELLTRPLKVLYDVQMGKEFWELRQLVEKHPDVEFVPVPEAPPGMDQRERMLSAFVLIAPWIVHGPWLLKLDTDCVAKAPNADWCSDRHIAPDERGRVPSFVAPGWSYCKPADVLARLDAWGNGVPGIKEYPPLNLPYDPKSRAVTMKGRIISWCFFGRVDWCQWLATICGRRLPVPSHDTLASFVAMRRGEFFRTVPFKRMDWTHVSRRNLEQECARAMA